MTIFGDGTQVRAFTYIDDVAPMIASSVDVPAARNQVFNLGADEPYTINELARIVAEEMGSECKVVHLDARNEVKVAYSDHSKAHHVFVKKPETTLQMGIRAMADWVKMHGARESSIFENIEVMKNMPPSWARVARRAVGGML
jgi:UDP-glucose 4-epimerase